MPIASERSHRISRWSRAVAFVLVAIFVALFAMQNRAEIPAAWRAVRESRLGLVVVAVGAMGLWLVNLAFLHAATQRAAGLSERPTRLLLPAAASNFLNLVTKSGGMAGLSMLVAHGRSRRQQRGAVVAAYLLTAVMLELSFAATLVVALVVVAADGRLTGSELGASLVFSVYLAGRVALFIVAARSRNTLRALYLLPRRVLSCPCARSTGSVSRSMSATTSPSSPALKMPVVWFRSWRTVTVGPSRNIPGSSTATSSSKPSSPRCTASRTSAATNTLVMLPTLNVVDGPSEAVFGLPVPAVSTRTPPPSSSTASPAGAPNVTRARSSIAVRSVDDVVGEACGAVDGAELEIGVFVSTGAPLSQPVMIKAQTSRIATHTQTRCRTAQVFRRVTRVEQGRKPSSPTAQRTTCHADDPAICANGLLGLAGRRVQAVRGETWVVSYRWRRSLMACASGAPGWARMAASSSK
jgi:uncharacterized integral membrane protein